jgi:hypothetical protein
MKTGIAVAALAVLCTAGCSNLYWHGEAFKNYYQGASKETGQTLEERQAIMHWKGNPKDKQRVGYLEKYTILLEGSRDPHTIYYIRDASGMRTLGYISENGAFFRYTRDGQAERVGEYPIYDVGIRVFYGFPKGDNLAFEDISTFGAD